MLLRTRLCALSALTCLFTSSVALSGHDNIEVDPAFKRYAGLVTALGSPDPEGRIYSFQAVQGGAARAKYVPDELRGWRLTVRNSFWSSRVRPHFINTRRVMFRTVLDERRSGAFMEHVF